MSGIDPSRVSACLVTRGDVDMSEVLDSLPFADVVVWDNSRSHDFGIYGRYRAMELARHDVIVTQDDDLVVEDWQAVLDQYEPGKLFVNYWADNGVDVPWVARGAVYDRSLPGEAFNKYLSVWPFDRDFTHWTCDAIFGLLSKWVEIGNVGGSRDLSYCNNPGRVSTSPGWYDLRRPEAVRRCGALA